MLDMIGITNTSLKRRQTNPLDNFRSDLEEVLGSRLTGGKKVLILVGSRRIREEARTLRTIAEVVRNHRCEPQLFPAIGGHSIHGRTLALLSGVGISEESCSMPIFLPRGDVTLLGNIDNECSIQVHSELLHYPYIVVNRIYPHTQFSGPIQSGLCKMLVIGTSTPEQAQEYHRFADAFGWSTLVKRAATPILRRSPSIGAVGIVEDGYGDLAELKVLRSRGILMEEKLLVKAKEFFPRIPVRGIVDVLIVDRMGKDICGCGMHPRTLRRCFDGDGPPLRLGLQDDTPVAKFIYVRDLTDASFGDATGIGLADFVHWRLYAKVNQLITVEGAMRAGHPESARMPRVVSDAEAIKAVCQRVGKQPTDLEAIHIQDTHDLETIHISSAIPLDRAYGHTPRAVGSFPEKFGC